MNPSQGNKWTAPVSLDEWKNKSASTKMDILAQLVAYHLAHDNAPPITLAEDGKTLIFPSVEEDANAVSRKHDSDRIIVFSLFPSSNEPLVQTYGFPVQLFHGNANTADPTKPIQSDNEDSGNDVMVVDEEPLEPKSRRKRGTKKAQAQAVQPPMSPTRPSTKRVAPTSPSSPSHPNTQPKPKKPKPKVVRKKDKGKQVDNEAATSSVHDPAAQPTNSGPSTPSMSKQQDISMQDTVDLTAAPSTTVKEDDSVAMDPDNDPILREMREDPTYCKDPDELDDMAMLNLHGSFPSSPLSSLPPSPTPFSDGVTQRTPRNVPSQPEAGPSNRAHTETIGGVDLVPGGSGSFRKGMTKAARRARGKRV
ncbi:hypothetical protein JVT61DRAFT_14101 [Boletus reticuloceps]|uniref:Uncharacterized protein n=1 Tax=Boletus reticuloceps TaxID=495285 RepID=A0A8I3AAX3_9AGAM|nr:hypothetical protein JVT61DRAFT_14101 [Boletus reticuloceps]